MSYEKQLVLYASVNNCGAKRWFTSTSSEPNNGETDSHMRRSRLLVASLLGLRSSY